MQALYARLKSSGWVRFLLDPEDELFVSCWPMPELASSIVRGKKGLLIGWYDERMAQEFLVGKSRSPGMTGFCASGTGGLEGGLRGAAACASTGTGFFVRHCLHRCLGTFVES